MGKIICEMCGNSDLLKDGDYFVCQFCSAKYTVEDARKMMIEGTVDVQGTVKVDNSDFIQKYLQNARRAKQKEDWEEVTKYYNLVEQNDPKNIEAIFYSAYGKAMMSLLTDPDIYRRQQIFNVVTKSVSVLDDYFDIEKKDELDDVFKEINEDIKNLFSTNYVYQYNTSTYHNNSAITANLQLTLATEYANTLINITKKCDDIIYNELIMDLCIFMIQRFPNDQYRWRNLYKLNAEELKKKNPGIHIDPRYLPYETHSDPDDDKKKLFIAIGIAVAIGIITLLPSIMSVIH
ncbi:MAG: hypothetical protein IJ045_05955 [Ruminiclostridium sp.]|nr:hypothetical protein [Ruminiclostridium sp.]